MSELFYSRYAFGHQNALVFDNRKFKIVEEHDNTLINNWNNVVSIVDDEIFILKQVTSESVMRFIICSMGIIL